MDTYQYDPTASAERPVFEPLPEGDYNFVVIQNPFAASNAPIKKENGRFVLNLKLAVGPEHVHVFANPWTGKDKNGKNHDNIGEFLRAVGRVPAPGTEVNWDKLIGAKGKAHIKTEISTVGKLAGKPVNVVAYFIAPKDVKAGVSVPAPAVKRGPQPPTEPDDLDMEPSDIPFRSTIYRDVRRSKLNKRIF